MMLEAEVGRHAVPKSQLAQRFELEDILLSTVFQSIQRILRLLTAMAPRPIS